MKNNLTNNNTKLLKQIQAELEKIQLSKPVKSTSKAKVQPVTETHKSSVAHDIKNSYIQNLHMKSSMFMLWLATAVLSYAHKIPYIKGLITALSVLYGRTTIWKILVKVRKAFIIFNALIGVFMVYKTVGFSYENVLAGFTGMGHSYIEILTNFTKRLFNWFVELFDHKVIPNVPGDKPSGLPKRLWGDPIDKDVFNPQYPKGGLVEHSLRDSYKSLLNLNVEHVSTPWYKDYSTWFWIIGGVCVVYLGYKLIIDPLFIHEAGRNVSGTDPRFGSQPTAGPSTQPEITLNDERTGSIVRSYFESFWNKTTRVYGGIRYGINPFNWFIVTEDIGLNSQAFKNFMERQNHMETSERHLYPFTTTNPYLPWFDQLRINLFGESVFENFKRFKDMELADRVVESLRVSKGKFREVVGGTPNIWVQSAVGSTINTPIPSFSFIDTIHTLNIDNRLKSIPSTPIINPVTLPVAENILQDVGEWSNHKKEVFSENTDNWLQSWKVASSSSTIPSTEINLIDFDDVTSKIPTINVETVEPKPSYSWIVSNSGKHK